AAKSSEDPQTQLATIESVAVDNLAEARRFVRDLAEARRFVRDLASPDVQESLPDALRGTLARMRERGAALGEKTEFRLEFAGDITATIPQPIAAAAIRCTQEGLSNVVKHAHASTAVVTLSVFADAVTID